MFETCSRFKVLKILLVSCLTLVLLQYVINLVAYNSTGSNIFGFEVIVQRFISNRTKTPVFGTLKYDIVNGTFRENLLTASPPTATLNPKTTVSYLPAGNSPVKSDVVAATASNATVKSNVAAAAGDATVKSGVVVGATNQSLPSVPTNKSVNLPLCPLIPPKLVGGLATYTDSPSFQEIFQSNPELQPGGRFKPKDCVARHRVAIIIPYRNRESQLKTFLKNIHPMLQRQLLDYGIYAIDMELPTTFNRALLMNIGYAESLKIHDYQCFVFHDVDLIPENDRNLYTCPESPRHMSVAIDKFRYKLPYHTIFGGVSALTKEQMIKTNGFSNKFFGWGGEDDDMYSRIHNKGYKVIRYSVDIARYRMLKHGREKANPVNKDRYKLMNQGKARQDKDGINSLKYEVVRRDFNPTHTYILTKVDADAVMKLQACIQLVVLTVLLSFYIIHKS